MSRLSAGFSASLGLAGALLVVACNSPWMPLEAPIAATHQLGHVIAAAVADQDLPQLSETVRVLTGKQVEFAAPPLSLADSGHQRSAVAGTIDVAAVHVAWTPAGHLQVKAELGKLLLPMSIGKSGAAACALKWLASGGSAVVSVRFAPLAGGQAQAELVDAPAINWQGPGFSAAEVCLAPLAPTAGASLDQQIRQMLADALLPRLSAAALHAMRASFAPQLALAGQTTVGPLGSPPLKLKVQSVFAADGSGNLLTRGANLTLARLDAAIDVARHACAVDTAPPQIAPQASVQPTQVPSGKSLLRRGLNLDEALIAHLGWAWVRAGGWCRQVPLSTAAPISVEWLQEIAPDLAQWLDSAPTAVRLWPHASAEWSVVDWQENPALEWTFSDATLEIVAPVGGAEAVVLTLRGRLRGVLRPAATSAGKVQLLFAHAAMDSAVVSSPLLGDAVAAGATERLAQLVSAAIQGISEPAAVLPLEALLPSGTVVTAVSRAGDSLWLWLDGGLQDGNGL